jgi:hypothetical protein
MENNDFCTLRNKGRFKPRFYPRWATTIFKTWQQNPIFAQWVISLNLVLAGLRLGLKNRQVGF